MNIHNQLLMNRLQATEVNQSSNMMNIATKSLSEKSTESDFFDTLKSSISSLEEGQLLSDRAIDGLITGEAGNLHQVMIKTSEAQISLELAVQLRNKCLEAMNEIKNMQF